MIHVQRALLIAIGALVVALPAAADDPPKGTKTLEFSGTIGPYIVGANMTVRDNLRIVGGHYFYASTLKNIPLAAITEGDSIILTEPGGGAFHLHLEDHAKGRTASDVRERRNFYNSTDLKGTWTLGATSLPVSLGLDAEYEDQGPHPWYAGVTDEPDAAYEHRVRDFVAAVLRNDREAAAEGVCYPMRFNRSKKPPLRIRSKSDLLTHWDVIFTPKLLAVLRTAIPHEMFVHEGNVMICDGSVWFNAKGVTAINRE